jgi:hypothetical protein
VVAEAIAALVDGRSLTEAEAAALRTPVTLSPAQPDEGSGWNGFFVRLRRTQNDKGERPGGAGRSMP